MKQPAQNGPDGNRASCETLRGWEREAQAYARICCDWSGRTLEMHGLAIRCDDGVMPPANRVTRLLARLLAGRTAAEVLDLGCGTGVLALVAASGGALNAVGVDIDAAAVACARGNADRNCIGNVRFLQGHAYEPVRGTAFDLIVSNPPFYSRCPAGTDDGAGAGVILRRSEYDLLPALIEGLPDHLTAMGEGVFVTSSLSENADVAARLERCGLPWSCTQLPGSRGSQSLMLWQVRRP